MMEKKFSMKLRSVKKKYTMTSLGLTSLAPHETVVVCSEQGEDKFDGVCDVIISEDGILENCGSMYYIGIVKGNDDDIVDLFYLVSFMSAVENFVVDFVRQCDALPSKTNVESLFDVAGWQLVTSNYNAPRYGLGEHCQFVESEIDYCKYTILSCICNGK